MTQLFSFPSQQIVKNKIMQKLAQVRVYVCVIRKAGPYGHMYTYTNLIFLQSLCVSASEPPSLGRSLWFDATQNTEQTFGIWDVLRQTRALRLTESGTQ